MWWQKREEKHTTSIDSSPALVARALRHATALLPDPPPPAHVLVFGQAFHKKLPPINIGVLYFKATAGVTRCVYSWCVVAA